VRTPELTRSGASEYGQLAPVTTDIADGSFNDEVVGTLRENRESSAQYADLSDAIPLRSMEVTSAEFGLRGPTQPKRIEWSYPSARTPVDLEWRSESGPLGSISYSVYDPFAQDAVARRNFFAGIAVSIAVASLLLLGERWLSSKERR
jgi:hypothetical protein